MTRAFVRARHALPLFCVMLILAGCNLPLEPLGSPPRPTVIVLTATGPYYETFDVVSTEWLLGDTDGSAGRIENGEYILTVKTASKLAWTHNARIFGGGVYEFDTTFISGPESSTYGLLLLAESDLSSFVYVTITDDGRYDISYCERWCDIQESLIGGLTLSYSILPGEEGNHIRIELNTGTLSLSINGAPVSQIQGITQASGLVGFIGESSQFGGFEATFDNLSVIEANSGAPTPELITPLPTPTIPPLIEPSPIPGATP
jgi:hypothetical protein